MDDKDLLIQQLKAMIAKLKAERVKVVRCKNCKYWGKSHEKESLQGKKCWILDKWRKANSYCDFGEENNND